MPISLLLSSDISGRRGEVDAVEVCGGGEDARDAADFHGPLRPSEDATPTKVVIVRSAQRKVVFEAGEMRFLERCWMADLRVEDVAAPSN